MADLVSASELAGELDTDPKRLGRWLRKQRQDGHPLLIGAVSSPRWTFSREHADELAEHFKATASAGRVSDSAVQRKAEAAIRDLLSERLEVRLEPKVIALQAGAPVHVDAVSPDERLLCEIFARQGALKGGQQKKVAIDALKLITVQRERPNTKLVIAFADEEASAYATGGGWVAQALRTWGITVEVVDIPQDLRTEILAAQKGQRMVNVDDVADDVD